MTWELFFDPGIFLEFISHHFIPNAKLSPASNVFDQIQLSLGTFFCFGATFPLPSIPTHGPGKSRNHAGLTSLKRSFENEAWHLICCGLLESGKAKER